jgi:hypothetical protein
VPKASSRLTPAARAPEQAADGGRWPNGCCLPSVPAAGPQAPTLAQVEQVAAAAVGLRRLRRQVMAANYWSLRDLYRTLETPGQNPLRQAHERLHTAVRAAYGMKANEDPLAFLLALNCQVADREAADQPVQGPGLPACVKEPGAFVTEDCVRVLG